MQNTSKKLIVLSFEGLAVSSLGCYGSSWNQTPGFDSIAATGCVWDRLITTNRDPNQVLRGWFCTPANGTELGSQDESWIEKWRALGTVELITDNPEIPDGDIDAAFDKTVLVKHQRASQDDVPCEEIEETQQAKLFASLFDQIESDSGANAIWLHSRALAVAWDAPRWLVPHDEDEYANEPPSDDVDLLDDESEAASETGPAAPPWCFYDVKPPFYATSKNDHPDKIVSWMRTYACQIQLIDRMLRLLSEETKSLDVSIVVVGASGFSLGQNGWVGHRSGPLRSSHHHVPLLIRNGNRRQAGPLRTSHVTNSTELNQLLIGLAENDSRLITPLKWSQTDSEFEPCVLTTGDEGEFSMTTPAWYMARQADGETSLFLKPDDLQDHNNVARIRNDVVEKLEAGM